MSRIITKICFSLLMSSSMALSMDLVSPQESSQQRNRMVAKRTQSSTLPAKESGTPLNNQTPKVVSRAQPLCCLESLLCGVKIENLSQRPLYSFNNDQSFQLSLFTNLVSSAPHDPFGPLVQEELVLKPTWSKKKQVRMTLGHKFFDILFKEYKSGITLKQLESRINGILQLPRLKNEDLLSVANAFRHLTHPTNERWKNTLGDYAAEYMISGVIKRIEAQPDYKDSAETTELLSSAYYQLSQTYTHLLVYGSKVSWNTNNPLKGRIYKNDKSVFPPDVFYTEILNKRLKLLHQAIMLDPTNDQAWIRIGEFYLGMEHASHMAYVSQSPNFFTSFTNKNFNSIEESNQEEFFKRLRKAVKNKDCFLACVSPEGETLNEILERISKEKTLARKRALPTPETPGEVTEENPNKKRKLSSSTDNENEG